MTHVNTHMHGFGPTLFCVIMKMSTFQVEACRATLMWFLGCTVVQLALGDPRCYRNCQLTDDSNVEICRFNRERSYHFSGCCAQCHWVNFRNISVGMSFDWSISSSYHYGQYNCINPNNNTVLRRVLTIPSSK